MEKNKHQIDQHSLFKPSGSQLKTVVSLSWAQRVLFILLPIVILWALVYWAS